MMGNECYNTAYESLLTKVMNNAMYGGQKGRRLCTFKQKELSFESLLLRNTKKATHWHIIFLSLVNPDICCVDSDVQMDSLSVKPEKRETKKLLASFTRQR